MILRRIGFYWNSFSRVIALPRPTVSWLLITVVGNVVWLAVIVVMEVVKMVVMAVVMAIVMAMVMVVVVVMVPMVVVMVIKVIIVTHVESQQKSKPSVLVGAVRVQQ